MPRLLTPTSPRRRARLIPAALLIAAGLFGAPTAVAAGPSGATAGTAAAATYEALCGPVPAPFARCDALRRTDIAAVPALSPGTTTNAGGASPAAFTGYTPSNLRSAYGLPSSGGSGRTVAIVDAYDLSTAAADLAVYRAAFGLPACTVASGCFRKVDEHGGTSYPASGAKSGWGGEIELDMDMVSAICPGCKILLVEATTSNLSDLGTAVDTAVRLGAVAVSNSYGGYEWAAEGGLDPDYNHPGVAITAATGDYGWADGVEYPAASPYVVSVGGTTLTQPTPGAWTQTAWPDSGSGCSLYEPKPYWQTDTGCTNKTTADISADADPNTGVLVYDTTSTPSGWYVFGGTSVASPIVAAAIALAGRPAAGSYPSRLLYDSAASLWDVTSGSNGSCGTYLCQAGAGYDGPTGLGTPNGTAALVPDVLDLGAGSRTSCALTSDGTISCWGYDGHGEANAPAGSYVALGTGDSHSCAIDTGGALHCWGTNSNGESSPPAGSYVTVSAGGADTCAIDTGGAIHCWGDGTHGVTSPPAGTYRAVSVGTYHACAINMSESLVCWGDNSHGQAAPPSGTFVAVSAGQYHTCALTSLAAISCWGDNSLGQLNAPAGAFIDLDAGANGACAVQLQGQVACWGDNSQGESSPPTVTASRVAMGAVHAMRLPGRRHRVLGRRHVRTEPAAVRHRLASRRRQRFPLRHGHNPGQRGRAGAHLLGHLGEPAGRVHSLGLGAAVGQFVQPGELPLQRHRQQRHRPRCHAGPDPGRRRHSGSGGPDLGLGRRLGHDGRSHVGGADPQRRAGDRELHGDFVPAGDRLRVTLSRRLLTCSFSGLTDRTSYTFSVYATNSQRTGARGLGDGHAALRRDLHHRHAEPNRGLALWHAAGPEEVAVLWNAGRVHRRQPIRRPQAQHPRRCHRRHRQPDRHEPGRRGLSGPDARTSPSARPPPRRSTSQRATTGRTR